MVARMFRITTLIGACASLFLAVSPVSAEIVYVDTLYEFINIPEGEAGELSPGAVPTGWDTFTPYGSGGNPTWQIDSNSQRRFGRINPVIYENDDWEVSHGLYTGTLLDSSTASDLENYSFMIEFTKSSTGNAEVMIRHQGDSLDENTYIGKLRNDTLRDLEIYKVESGVESLLATSHVPGLGDLGNGGYLEIIAHNDALTLNAYFRGGTHVQGPLVGTVSVADTTFSGGSFGVRNIPAEGNEAIWAMTVRSVVPEPSCFILASLGIIGFVVFHRRRVSR